MASTGSSARSVAGALLAFGPIIFLVLTTIAEAEYPGYNVGRNTFSDLGALGQPTMILWDSTLFASGALQFLGFAIFMTRTSLVKRRRILVGLLYLVPQIGFMIAAMFPENWIPALHAIGATMILTLVGISVAYSFTFTQSPFRYVSLVLGALSIGATPLLGGATSLVGLGLAERLVLYPYYIWLIVFATYLLASRE